MVLMALLCPDVEAAFRYAPSLRFHSITTRHFVIHYHQGVEVLALRLASIAEEEHVRLVARLGHAPRARTQLVLVDQDDEPNGWTTVVPYNLIELRAAPPTGAEYIGNTDDWLRLVFVHEYSHVLHLDPARGWARAARFVFGRAYFAFPNAFLPEWQVEGIATWSESAGGQGRLWAGDFHTIVSEAARNVSFEPLDRVNGGLVAWPSGEGWYAYGTFFHQYLAERFGAERLAELSARTAGRLPYLSSGAFKTVFGESLGALWSEYAAEERTKAVAVHDDDPAAVRLTTRGYRTDGPRFDADGSLLYTRQDADVFPSIERLRSDARAERVVSRYGGGQIAPAADAIYFDQLEVSADVALQSDLYRLDRATGDVRRLTQGARLAEPDASPDGRRIAAIRIDGGERRLVLLDRAALDGGGRSARDAVASSSVFGRPGDIMATPRWSPDSRRVAVELRPVQGPSSIVVFEAGRALDPGEVVARSRGRVATPAWTADGRAVVYAEALPGTPFQLMCVHLGQPGARQSLTSLAGGARSPDVSPDGSTVAFVGYTEAGQDVFTLPLSCSAPALDAPGGFVGGGPGNLPHEGPPWTAGRDPPRPRPRGYSPWSTLWPRAWYPVVDTSDDEVRVGANVGGVDALGYHAWSSTATWSVARPDDLAAVAPGARPDVSAVYVYDRWRPSFFAEYSDETTPVRVAAADGTIRPVAVRERAGEFGLSVPFRRVRFSQALFAAYRIEHDAARGPGASGSLDRGAVRAGWTFSSARRYGYSISPEDGVAIGAGLERAATALGSDGNAALLRADVRAYLAGGPPHAIIALRASAARSSGDRIARRVLRLGGSDADTSVLSFDDDATSLLRGFRSGEFTGWQVALVNAEYRLPLARIERGHGTWPIFVRMVHATAFFDAGDAWSSGATSLADWKQSWGAELSADVVAGFSWPLTLTAGVAWGHDGQGEGPSTRRVYVRVGDAF